MRVTIRQKRAVGRNRRAVSTLLSVTDSAPDALDDERAVLAVELVTAAVMPGTLIPGACVMSKLDSSNTMTCAAASAPANSFAADEGPQLLGQAGIGFQQAA